MDLGLRSGGDYENDYTQNDDAVNRSEFQANILKFLNESLQMDLQRRGHTMGDANQGRVYWRCYFNAVTCF